MRTILLGLLALLGITTTVPTGPANPAIPDAVPRFVRPVPGTVSRPFDPGAHRYAPGHRGVDLADSGGVTVRAAGAGTVAFVGEVAGRPVISVEHGGGLRTTYEPVTASVSVGKHVSTGDPIGKLLPGHPGCVATACLHWGLRQHTPGGEVYLDPLLLLGRGAVRLKPLQPGDRPSS